MFRSTLPSLKFCLSTGSAGYRGANRNTKRDANSNLVKMILKAKKIDAVEAQSAKLLLLGVRGAPCNFAIY
jgi:hypothetical protein